MSGTSDELTKKIDLYRFNPSAMFDAIIDRIEAMRDGELVLVDPTNPLITLLEANVLTATACMAQSETIARRLYPAMATEDEDLYRHMSDADYLGRFSFPSTALFELMFYPDELKNIAVLDEATQYRKIVIPKHTVFTVGGYTFGIFYPIEIRILSSGAFQIVYDGNESSPLADLNTNAVEHEYVSFEGNKFLKLYVPVFQYRLTPNYVTIGNASGNIHEFPYRDQFYFCRVYHGSQSEGWKEMKTTHSEQVYDPLDPTALLTVLEGKVRVEIPEVYLSHGRMGTQIRVDMLSTLGELDVILSDYNSTEYGAAWRDYDNTDNGKFSAPLSSISALSIFCSGTASGGSNGIDFDELRQRVMNNGTNTTEPVSDYALEASLRDRGYSLFKQLDDLTHRRYLATRELPAPEIDTLSSSIGTFTEVIEVRMDTLADLSTVIDNNTRLTIEPNTLYRYESGKVKALTDTERNDLITLTTDRLLTALNETQYLYTPFHYVLDFDENAFEVRPYYLAEPEILGKRHVQENVNIKALTSSGVLSIEKTTTGFTVLILVPESNIEDQIDIGQLTVQLGFTPERETNRVYLNGTYLGKADGNFVYEFQIESTFDFDTEGNMSVDNFRLHPSDVQTYFMPLTAEFNIYFALSSYPIIQRHRTDIDRRMGRVLLPTNSVGNSEEAVTIQFGTALTALRNESRSVVGSLEYERWEGHVYKTYEEDVIERDELGVPIYRQNADTGEIEYTILHRKGEQELDGQGNPMILYYTGDPKLDGDGNPIVKETRKLHRHFAITLFDARYLFSGNTEVSEYRGTIPKTIIGYLENDVQEASKGLLERTTMKFSPKRTLANIKVTEKDGKVVTVPSAQSFTVDYYLTENGYRDAELRAVLNTNTNTVIAEILKRTQVTLIDINNALKAMGGEEVVSVKTSGLGDGTMEVYTVMDPSATSTVATKLEVGADGVINLMDDITINFLRHRT